jgi:hypothetical protein
MMVKPCNYQGTSLGFKNLKIELIAINMMGDALMFECRGRTKPDVRKQENNKMKKVARPASEL